MYIDRKRWYAELIYKMIEYNFCYSHIPRLQTGFFWGGETFIDLVEILDVLKINIVEYDCNGFLCTYSIYNELIYYSFYVSSHKLLLYKDLILFVHASCIHILLYKA